MMKKILRTLMTGPRRYDQVPQLTSRFLIGTFFVTTGAAHIFLPDQHQALVTSLAASSVPMPEVAAYLVALIEFVFGAMLAVGFLTPVAAAALTTLMVVTIVHDRIHDVVVGSWLAWIGSFLYLPEVLYILILSWLFFARTRPWSVDGFLLRRASRTDELGGFEGAPRFQ